MGGKLCAGEEVGGGGGVTPPALPAGRQALLPRGENSTPPCISLQLRGTAQFSLIILTSTILTPFPFSWTMTGLKSSSFMSG